jgi:hypothetical protein
MAFHFLGGLSITENEFAIPGIESNINRFASMRRANSIPVIVNRNLPNSGNLVLPRELAKKMIDTR